MAAFVVWAGLAGLSRAAGANGNVQAYGSSAGIQDPTNPEAYMRDLASRMGSQSDPKLLLNGVDGRKATPAPTGRPGQGTRVTKTNAPSPAGTGVAGRNAGTGAIVPSTSKTAAGGSVVPSSATNLNAGTVPPTQNPTLGGPVVPPANTNRATATVPPRRNLLMTGPVVPPTATNRSAEAGFEASNPAPSDPNVPSVAAVLQTPAEGTNPSALSTIPRFTPPVGRAADAGTGATPARPTMLIAPGERVQLPPSVAAASATPAVLSAPTVPAAPRAAVPQTGTPRTSPAALGNGTSPMGSTQIATRSLMAQAAGTTERDLIAGRPGLTLTNEQQLAREEARAAAAKTGSELPPEPAGPWTLGGDLEKYRAHAVKEGSRNSGENLKKALQRAGMTVGDGVNVFVLGYGSDRAKPFRENDGKGIFQEPGKVPARAGATIGSLGYALYSIVDLAALNSLPDPNQPAYKDNSPLVRPILFTGRTIGGLWKTTEEVGNALTWGLFDNVTGCIGLVIEDIVELVKHAGEAVTNVVRAPFHLAAGKKSHEGTDKTLDWILLVPLELASNSVEMKGFSNMEDYKNAFASKGVIGSVLEFGGSTYIVYRAVDELLDRNKKDSPRQTQNNNGQSGGPSNGGSGGDTPTTPTTPETPQTPTSVDYIFFDSDGNITAWSNSNWYGSGL